MYETMLARKKRLFIEKEKLAKAVSSFPKGKLEVYKDHGGVKWVVKEPGKERVYLPKKEKRIAEELALKRIYETRIDEINKEIFAIELYLRHCVSSDKILKNISENRKYYNLIPEKKTGTDWANEEFQTNPFHPEMLKFPSPSGHVLRSKSECLIDLQLYYRKIPFRYECLLEIGYGEYYPDFTFFKPQSGELKYWEHFGMMDSEKYEKKAISKMDFYASNGLYPDVDVLYTFETSDNPLTLTRINKVIDEIEEWLRE